MKQGLGRAKEREMAQNQVRAVKTRAHLTKKEGETVIDGIHLVLRTRRRLPAQCHPQTPASLPRLLHTTLITAEDIGESLNLSGKVGSEVGEKEGRPQPNERSVGCLPGRSPIPRD